jgi:acyl-CoA thioesterase
MKRNYPFNRSCHTEQIDIAVQLYILDVMPEKLDSIKEAKIREKFPQYPLPSTLGMEIERLEYGMAGLHLRHKTELTQGGGFIHGGAISALCDTAAGVALHTMIDDADKILTIELKINFIAPASGDIYCLAKIIHKGRKTAVGEVDVTGESGELVAKGLLTFYIFRD